MSETKQEVTQRKIRNGLRKQEEAHKMKVWDAIKYGSGQVYAAPAFEFRTVSAMTMAPYAAPPLDVITRGGSAI